MSSTIYPRRWDRRTLLTAGLAIGVIAPLAGCSDDSPATDAPAGNDDAAGFPLTLEHRYGTTEIPQQPQRVVTAGFNDADFALAVGVVPIGVADFIGEFPEESRPWAQDALGDAEPTIVTSETGELDFEAIAGLQPDLIIFYNYLEEDDYQQLTQIAPTVVEPKPGTLWRQHTLDVGRALGYPTEAQQAVDEVEARFADAREAHPEFEGVTAALLFGVGEETNYFLLEPTDARVGLFVSLGFELPETTGDISKERADLIDQDLIVVIGVSREDLDADPVFSTLQAPAEGRVAYLGGFEGEFAGALGFDSPLSLPAALDLAVPELARALAGA